MTKKIAVLFALTLGMLAGCCYTPLASYNVGPSSTKGYTVAAPLDQWQQLAQTPLVIVYAERSVYSVPEVEGFFLRLRLKNITSREVVADLGDYTSTIRPEAWDIRTAASGPTPSTQPGIVVEQLADNRIDLVLNDNPGPSVIRIPPKMATDVYVLATRQARDPDALKGTGTLIIDIAGSILVTDGQRAEKISAVATGTISPDVEVQLPSHLSVSPSGSLMIDTEGPPRLSPTTGAVVEPSTQPEDVPYDDTWESEIQPETAPASETPSTQDSQPANQEQSTLPEAATEPAATGPSTTTAPDTEDLQYDETDNDGQEN